MNKKDYTVTYANNVEKAEADDSLAPTVIITGKGNCSGTVEAHFRIYEKAASTFAVDKIGAQTYTGTEIQPQVVIYANAKDQKAKVNALEEGVHYTVSYENNVNAGTGKVIITGIGQYGGSKTVTFKIKK